MKGFPAREEVERIKKQYPIGTIIEMSDGMDDPYAPIAKGVRGEVIGVDDIGTLHMRWQNGRSLGVVPGKDSFKVISKPEEQRQSDSKIEMGGMNI